MALRLPLHCASASSLAPPATVQQRLSHDVGIGVGRGFVVAWYLQAAPANRNSMAVMRAHNPPGEGQAAPISAFRKALHFQPCSTPTPVDFKIASECSLWDSHLIGLYEGTHLCGAHIAADPSLALPLGLSVSSQTVQCLTAFR